MSDERTGNHQAIDAFRAAYLRGMAEAAKIAERLNSHYSGFTGEVYKENVERAIRRAAAIARRSPTLRGKPRYARADKGRILHLILPKASNALCGARPNGPWNIRTTDREPGTLERVCARCVAAAGGQQNGS